VSPTTWHRKAVVIVPLVLLGWCSASASRAGLEAGRERGQIESDQFFRGDFETGDLSQWPELFDAQLGRDPPGVRVVRAPTFHSQYAAKIVTLNSPDSSVSGDGSFVEQSGYDLPWVKEGSVWHRFQVLLPSGKARRYPGRFRINPGWNMFMEWHNPPCSGCSGNYPSSYVGVSRTPHLALRIAGGLAASPTSTLVRDRRRLRYDHWYDMLVRFVYSDSSTDGWYEWWVDRKLVASGHTPTLYRLPDGSTRGNRFAVGHYRRTVGYRDTVYIDGVVVGPDRSSLKLRNVP
jgi:hypothetical protein